jgi:hypothetical protein
MLRILERKEDEINVFRLAPMPENDPRQVMEDRQRIDSLDEFFLRFTRSKFKTRLPIALEEAHSNAEGRQEKTRRREEGCSTRASNISPEALFPACFEFARLKAFSWAPGNLYKHIRRANVGSESFSSYV